jgi:hypothetical protein
MMEAFAWHTKESNASGKRQVTTEGETGLSKVWDGMVGFGMFLAADMNGSMGSKM